MTRILVTGGTGFLGKHLIPILQNSEDQIFAPSSQELHLLDPNCYREIAEYKPHTILHMAAICGGIVKNSHLPADFLRDNTQMALNIYEAGRKLNIKNIYSLGSVCMYPLHCPTPFKEDDIWNGGAEPTNFPYGQAKRTLMMLGQTYRQQYGFTGAHLIPVNMYGEFDSFDDQKSHVIPALIKKFLHAKNNDLPSVECLGTGSATREFLYAGDAAGIIAQVVLTNFDCELPINLGIGQDITIKDLAILIKKLVGYQGQIIFKADGLDGQPKRLLDVSRAKQLLNWTASTSLEEGLKRTISWYQDLLLNGDASQ
jgi:GDP-L-fucose synthase